MSLAIVRSNTLLIRGARDKEVYILQIPDMADWAVMAFLAVEGLRSPEARDTGS